jgi:DNA-directed RNA polymerase subunit M/transcription elongation factor TFIIS
MGKVMLEGYKCERCEHTWLPRATTEETPTICPKCKSPYWNKARKIETKKEFNTKDKKRHKIYSSVNV